MAVHYRQGDVLLLAVDDIPADVVPVPREGGQVVLAHGEATGHRHVLLADRVELLATPDDLRFLEIVGRAELVHEEHDPIPVPAGRYQVIRQREFTPDLAGYRSIAD